MPVLRIPAPWIAGLAAVLALAILALAFVLLRGGGDAGDGLSVADLRAEFAPREVAADDLFLPAEPDFLPALIRYREPKTAWTAADAAPYWTDPAELDPAPLAAAAAAAVDALLETAP